MVDLTQRTAYAVDPYTPNKTSKENVRITNEIVKLLLSMPDLKLKKKGIKVQERNKLTLPSPLPTWRIQLWGVCMPLHGTYCVWYLSALDNRSSAQVSCIHCLLDFAQISPAWPWLFIALWFECTLFASLWLCFCFAAQALNLNFSNNVCLFLIYK